MIGARFLTKQRLTPAGLVAALLLFAAPRPAHADPIPVGEIRMDGLRSRFNVVGGGAVAGEFVVNASRLSFTPQGLGKYGAAIQCLDTDGDRYSTMAFEAADATSWFETCIRTLKGGKAGSSYWILDDFQLFVHDNEMLTDVDDWMLY